MIKKIFVFVNITFFFVNITFSQKTSVYGYIIAKESGEPVMYAHCVNLNGKERAVSNEKGFFSIKLPKQKAQLKFSHIAFLTDTLTIDLKNDTVIYIKLGIREIGEVTVIPDEVPVHVQTLSGKISISPKKIENLPSFLGEPDIIKTITYLPGVTGGNKGFSNLYVRGSGRQHNLFLVDGAPIFSTNHVFGVLSIFF